MHVEWALLPDLSIEVVPGGWEAPDGQFVDDAPMAVTLFYDGDRMLVIEGSRDQLAALFLRAHNALPAAPEHTGTTREHLPNRPGR